MSSSDGHAHAHAHHPHLAHHFDTIEKQDYAARLGMWLFLGTEVLLFAGLFLGYTVYRHFYHETFHHCSRALNITLGTTNTLVLITQQLDGRARLLGGQGRQEERWRSRLLVVTIVCALGFLGIKYLEYAHKFEVGELPGQMVPRRGADEVPGGEHVLHDLLPDDGPARVPRHRRDVGAALGAEGHRQGPLHARLLRPRRAGRACTGTSSTWSGSSCSRSSI